MNVTDFSNQYIQGEMGHYWFQIELPLGKEISGGQFYRKKDAVAHFLDRLSYYLDDPDEYPYNVPGMPPRPEKKTVMKLKKRKSTAAAPALRRVVTNDGERTQKND
jgi:hypothetical protein